MLKRNVSVLCLVLLFGLLLAACSSETPELDADLAPQNHKTRTYQANFNELNNSGASANATLVAAKFGNFVRVNLQARGLLDGATHLQHIHGSIEEDNVCPPASADVNGDGFIDLAEGVPFYGGILVTLGTDDAGAFSYSRSFDTLDDGSEIESIYPLGNQHIVIHGVDVNGDGDLDDGRDIDGDGAITGFVETNFELTLPALCGELTAQKK